MEYNLSTIRPLNGYYLVQLDADYTEFNTKGGLSLQIGTRTENDEEGGWMGQHFAITGRILAKPETLVFNRHKLQRLKENKHGDPAIVREWAYLQNSSLEVFSGDTYEVGDKVWFMYLEQISIISEGRTLRVKECGDCAFILQDKFFASQSPGENPRPVNGWVWIHPDDEPDYEDRAGLLTTLHKKERVKYATVIDLAPPVEYLDLNASDGKAEKLTVGCRIAYNADIVTPLEHQYHQSKGLEKVFKLRRKDIFFVQ